MNIRHIAEKAGVSVATVSRVLNHPEHVAPATKAKIESIIAETEYIPNWFARGLNLNKTGTIGLVIPNMLNPENMEIVKGAEDVAQQKDYISLLCNVENDAKKENKYIDNLIKRRVDGILLISSLLSEKEVMAIIAQGIPVVHVGETTWNDSVPIVSIDSKDAAYKATTHFLETGVTKIGILYGETPEVENNRKIKGYEKALKEEKISVIKEYEIQVENTIEGGYLGARKFMNLPNPPNAIFATSDLLAFGVMDAMKDGNISVPEQVAVIGFGNIRMSNLVEPKLTTVEKPLHKMGVVGARLLFDLIEGKNKPIEEVKNIQLQSKLKIRKSCGHKERIGEMF
ncbi:MAG: LacI family DNA-binding transcriptional regulator [Peptostreptococcaceae bacterium]|nr:LacI family DNA-binding transcriptional regulator [Peptostreptococcaceae bacterium]